MLDLSGERHGASISQPVDAEHWHRYLFALQVAENRKILDIASGEGYGTALLATRAHYITGVDADADAIKHASKKYIKQNLAFVKGTLESIPLPNASVSLITCFETIEHIVAQQDAMQELCRVLTDDGILILSTPDKTEYSTKRNYVNPFHLKELEMEELEKLLQPHFSYIKLYCQRFYAASIIQDWNLNADKAAINKVERICNGDFTQESMQNEPMYWIALASNSILPEMQCGIFDILEEWQRQIVAAQQEIYKSKSYKLGNAFVRAINRFRSK